LTGGREGDAGRNPRRESLSGGEATDRRKLRRETRPVPHPPAQTLPRVVMNRADAYAVLCEYVSDISLRRHCMSVEAAMRAYARKLGHDEETWGVVGLLHDFDYERWPTAPDHPLKGSEILRAKGYPEEVITCILSHADYLQDRYPRRTVMEKGLYACDEITGLVTATAL